MVQETLRDCLTEAMDVEGLTHVLQRIETGAIRCVAIDTPTPSSFSHEILNAKSLRVSGRRAAGRAAGSGCGTAPDAAGGLLGEVGALDAGAIDDVVRESWPVVRDADELHDALLTLVWVPCGEVSGWQQFMTELLHSGRAAELTAGNGKSLHSRLGGHRACGRCTGRRR